MVVFPTTHCSPATQQELGTTSSSSLGLSFLLYLHISQARDTCSVIGPQQDSCFCVSSQALVTEFSGLSGA